LALYIWIGLILNLMNLLDYDYNELESNWFELDSVIAVPQDDICCDLALYR